MWRHLWKKHSIKTMERKLYSSHTVWGVQLFPTFWPYKLKAGRINTSGHGYHSQGVLPGQLKLWKCMLKVQYFIKNFLKQSITFKAFLQATILELGFWAPMHCENSRGLITATFSILSTYTQFNYCFRTSPSLSFLLPSSRLWSQDEVLVQTSTRNYTVNDFKDFFKWEMTKKSYLLNWNVHKKISAI